ncbi:MAG: aspartate-semialdehyde dehydrogenase [Candidatus Aminicenantes bacterium]|nr:aspartate-semialdehyde dehydrogenase [Candidatus Aminicenantes bacterium]
MTSIDNLNKKDLYNRLKKKEEKFSPDTSLEKSRIKVAVLGASGLVGQHFVRLLGDHPFFELAYITSSEKNAGQRFKELAWPELFSPASSCPISAPLPEKISNLVFQFLDHNLPEKLKAENIRVVFSALPASVALVFEPLLRNQGLAVFTNASACRIQDEVPLIIPEVNAEHLALVNFQKEKFGGFIVAGSNCCVAGLALTLKPLLSWSLKKVRLTTFQSISGAGFSGLRALDIHNNLIPFIKEEEQKIARETVKILGYLYNRQIISSSFPLQASCVRVPVRFGHLLEVEVEFQNVPSLEEIIKRLATFPGLVQHNLPSAPEQPIVLLDEENRPQPAYDLWMGTPASARGMAVALGRLRLADNTLRYFVLTNNLIRGAAGNCLLTAELAFSLGYIN